MADQKKKVLIVDDARLARYVLKSCFNENDFFEVAGEASNGIEAIRLFKMLKPDLVTMDLDMPKMGGAEAIEEILKIDKFAKIVVVSAMEQKEMIIEAKKKGARTFIKKPIDKDEIKLMIEAFIKNELK
jgi:two-component system chemotaxis response regulator CheY